MWDYIRMRNTQSWVDQIFKMSKGLTVIEGPSETGKSVFIKCLRLALNYDTYRPRDRRAIVRDWEKTNAEPAQFMIGTDSGHKVVFTYGLTNIKTTVVYPDGRLRSYSGPADKETQEIISLVTSSGTDRILNILDNETPMFLDGTERTYNNNILGEYIIHKETQLAIETASNNVEEYKSNLRSIAKDRDELNYQMSTLAPVGDIESVEAMMPVLEKLDIDIINLEKAIRPLAEIADVLVVPTTNTTRAEDTLNRIQELGAITKHLSNLIDDKLPTTDNLEELEILQRNIRQHGRLIECLSQITYEAEIGLINTDSLSDVMYLIEVLTKLVSNLNLLLDTELSPIYNIETLQQQVDSIENSQNLVQTVVTLLHQQHMLQTSIEECEASQKALEHLHEQLQVCPVCNSPFLKGEESVN